MVVPGRDPNKPIPSPSTKDEMLNVFGFKQSHCDFCQKEQDPVKGQILRMCACKGKYFCKPCSFTHAVQNHQVACSKEKLKNIAHKLAMNHPDKSRSVLATSR